MPRKSKRRSWTSSDVRTLKTMARRKTGAASIARTLKRTEGATRQKAFSLGLSLELAFVIRQAPATPANSSAPSLRVLFIDARMLRTEIRQSSAHGGFCVAHLS